MAGYRNRRSKTRSRRRIRVLRRSINRRIDPDANRKRAMLILWLLGRLAMVVLMFCAFVAAGLFLQDRYRELEASDTFALENLLIEGTERLSRERIMEELGLAMGTPLLTLDMDVLETRLELMPWVMTAEVHRRLPHTLEIRVREREPAAIVVLGRLYLVDVDGNVFKQYTQQDKDIVLPLITGIDRDSFVGSPEQGKARLKKALSLLFQVQEAGVHQSEISEIHLTEFGGGTLVLADGLRVHLPDQHMKNALQRLQLVLADLERRHWSAREVFLDNRVNPREVTVRIAHDRGRKPGNTY